MNNPGFADTDTPNATNTNADTKKGANAPLSDKMRDTLHTTVDTLSEKAGSAEKAVRDGANHSAEALSEKQQQLQESWEASSMRKYATENPVATAGIVFIAGALFGKFMSRS